MVEGLANDLVKKIGLEDRLRRVSWLGYLWVWCWFVYSLHHYWDSMLYSGMFEEGEGLSFLIASSRGDWFYS